MVHAFLALLAGFATITALVTGLEAILNRLSPEWARSEGKLQPGYAFVNLGWAFLAAALGGYVTARVSAANPLIHVLVLAIAILAIAALSVLQERGKHPIWYALTLLALMPLGVLAGGLVLLRVLGIL